jgi:hypothetical protein
MMMKRTALAMGLLTAIALAAGCNKSHLIEIGGAVTYDGKPVSNGNIRFLPADGRGPTAAGAIVDGQYSAKVPPGTKRIEIDAYRVIGQRRHGNDPTNPLEDIRQQILPVKHNAKSELTCDIQSGKRVYDFTLNQ